VRFTLEALARGALRGFLPGPSLLRLFRDPGAAVGLSFVTAQQVAAVGGIICLVQTCTLTLRAGSIGG